MVDLNSIKFVNFIHQYEGETEAHCLKKNGELSTQIGPIHWTTSKDHQPITMKTIVYNRKLKKAQFLEIPMHTMIPKAMLDVLEKHESQIESRNVSNGPAISKKEMTKLYGSKKQVANILKSEKLHEGLTDEARQEINSLSTQQRKSNALLKAASAGGDLSINGGSGNGGVGNQLIPPRFQDALPNSFDVEEMLRFGGAGLSLTSCAVTDDKHVSHDVACLDAIAQELMNCQLSGDFHFEDPVVTADPSATINRLKTTANEALQKLSGGVASENPYPSIVLRVLLNTPSQPDQRSMFLRQAALLHHMIKFAEHRKGRRVLLRKDLLAKCPHVFVNKLFVPCYTQITEEGNNNKETIRLNADKNQVMMNHFLVLLAHLQNGGDVTVNPPKGGGATRTTPLLIVLHSLNLILSEINISKKYLQESLRKLGFRVNVSQNTAQLISIADLEDRKQTREKSFIKSSPPATQSEVLSSKGTATPSISSTTPMPKVEEKENKSGVLDNAGTSILLPLNSSSSAETGGIHSSTVLVSPSQRVKNPFDDTFDSVISRMKSPPRPATTTADNNTAAVNDQQAMISLDNLSSSCVKKSQKKKRKIKDEERDGPQEQNETQSFQEESPKKKKHKKTDDSI